ncbi:YjcZ family sporulation protein [Bacillus sp. AK031]
MHYGYDDCYYAYPAAPVAGVSGYNNGFALIVVLFILLIIIGAVCYAPKC